MNILYIARSKKKKTKRKKTVISSAYCLFVFGHICKRKQNTKNKRRQVIYLLWSVYIEEKQYLERKFFFSSNSINKAKCIKRKYMG